MSTDATLDRIDEAVTAWEARPESWLPGDPLHDRPRGDGYGEQTVRHMVQLIDDALFAPRARCEPCQVSWRGDGPCWSCGGQRSVDSQPTPRRPMEQPPAPGRMWVIPQTTTAWVTVDVRPYMEALTEAAARLTDLYAEHGETLHRLTLHRWVPPERRDGPEPLCIDGHAYRRRTRNRRSR